MTTLIIPCAGKSSRFPNMKPKWMLTHPNGNLMIQEAISGMDLSWFDRIIITIVKEHSKKYDAKIILEQVFDIKNNKKIEVLELDDFTTSQSQTVYETLKMKKVKGSFVVKDSDNFVKINKIKHQEFIVGLDINNFSTEIFRLKSKSFVVKNDQNIITGIIEKKISSENICLGIYGFNDPCKFMDTFEKLSKQNNKNEIYLSHIIYYLICTDKSVYKYIEAQDFEDWGTLEDWRNAQNRYATYFLDIDGVIVENRGKYGKENWSNYLNVIKENLDFIKKIYKEGAQIVLTSSRGKKDVKIIKDLFKKEKIKIHAIITNCNHSPRVIVNDFSPTNPYPSCVAINIPRNGNLVSYLKNK